MTRPVWTTSLGSEFDEFLFAPIGEEGNGMLLSVISALARLDLDPWQEATRLAAMPGETATKRIASLIAALPEGPSTHRDTGMIAARLTALLPRRTRTSIASRKALLGTDDTDEFRVGTYMYVGLFVFILATQWIVARHQPAAQVDDAHTPASSIVSPQMPPPNLGR